MEKKMAEGRRSATKRGGGFIRARAAAAAFITVLSFVVSVSVLSCDNGDDDFTDNHKLNPILVGTFKSSYGDSFTITSTTLSNSGFTDYDYEGNIDYVSNFNETFGVIIINFTSSGSSTGYTIGKYIGVYYKIIDNNTIDISIATDPQDSEKELSTDTLDEAKIKFTEGASSSYASIFGTYTKQ